MTAEETKREVEKLQVLTGKIKQEVATLRMGVSSLEGVIRQANAKTEEKTKAMLAEVEKRSYERGYENGFAEGREPAEGTDAYQRGMTDAWAAARKLFSEWSEKDIEEAFPKEWKNGGFRALMNLDPNDAVIRTKNYEEVKATAEAGKIREGDQVIVHDSDEELGTVLFADHEKAVILTLESVVFTGTDCVEKTGIHFDEVDQLLEKMRK